MRIAFVTETWWPSTDGVVTRITATLRELKRLGHQLLVIAPHGGAANFEGTRVHGVPSLGVFFIYGGKRWGLPLPRVARYLDEFRPDIVHVVNPFVLGVAGVRAAVRRGYPLVASYHTNIAKYADFYHLGFTKPAIWAILRALHNRAHVNLVTSLAIRQELEAQGIERVHLWRRGVDLTLFHPSRRTTAMRERLTGGHPDRPVALYVGRIALEKGLHRLDPLLRDNGRVHLALVGDGPSRRQLERHYAGRRVTFMGTLHGETLAEAYASSDVFVFPSTTETLGLVVLEAMASGLPIVAAESGPSRELVGGSRTGALFAADRPHEIAPAVESLLDQQGANRNLAEEARREAEKWGWRQPTEELVRLYETACERARGLQ